ncbi:hypothetical protein E4U35_000270 [Claviceps purpurea]|nr:hypothetical protein E4U11_000630 [Claviceps purpurea]KAG6148877.1 hypothetical protein E4U37_007197 [Claviceps purpurea]KAG6181245.1 hypothetical protein E4U10_007349 [Claviceps purpurea]KAG6194922.1 hypothetical protein E4U35_000270 [Claviceps purpurea]KAG6204826.1 hypothetical protein E4U34_000211 [Claviceps purpurea]
MQRSYKNRFEHAADSASGPGRGTIAENCVEYYLFIIDHQSDHVTLARTLETLRRAAVELCQSLTNCYIWQRDEFSVELKISHGLMFLYGITDYGEAIEDEWLIVYILRELTRSFPSLWVRVADTDGEFLLIEAANTLPDWISPEIDENRVWLHHAKLHIIPLHGEFDHKNEDTGKLSLWHAVEFLRQTPNALLYSYSTENEAFYRLQKYPSFVKFSSHHALVTVPRRVAYVLHTLPKSIAMAIEMFYLRDAMSLQHVMSESSTLVFPPNDLVTISAHFSKILFAQLRSQQFKPPPRWRRFFSTIPSNSASAASHISSSQLDTGMKITIGYEMLAKVAKASKHRVVRELDILLQDLLQDGDKALPTDKDIETWRDSQRNDDDSWLDITFSDFEQKLEVRPANQPEKAPAANSGADSQVDIQKIVSRLEEFLHDEKAGVDGVSFDDIVDDDNADADDEISAKSDGDTSSEREIVEFDENTFAQLITNLMSPTHSVAANAVGNGLGRPIDDALPVARGNKSEIDEMQQLTAQFEAELEHHGALKLDHSDSPCARETNPMHSHRRLGQPSGSSSAASDTGAISVDFHLAQNILESFKSQAGMAGPASNLLGLMGITLPRDEED